MSFATGVEGRRLGVEGMDRLIGQGVYYGAARSETVIAQGLDLHLVGAGNSAGQAALYFASHARRVTLLVRGDSLERTMSHDLTEQVRAKSNITVDLFARVAALHGEAHLTALDVRDRRPDRLASARDRPRPERLHPHRGRRDARGPLAAPPRSLPLESSVPGMFACGDLRLSPVKRVAAAVGEGSMAIALVHQYLQGAADPRRGVLPDRRTRPPWIECADARVRERFHDELC